MIRDNLKSESIKIVLTLYTKKGERGTFHDSHWKVIKEFTKFIKIGAAEESCTDSLPTLGHWKNWTSGAYQGMDFTDQKKNSSSVYP